MAHANNAGRRRYYNMSPADLHSQNPRNSETIPVVLCCEANALGALAQIG